MRRFSTGLRGIAVGVWVVAAACSSSRTQENVGSTSQAVTNPSAARVLSFEQPTADWSATSLTLQQGNQFVDGQHSAAVTVLSSGGKLTSIPLSSLGPISSTVTLQVRLPAYVASNSWQGQIALWLNSPTAGVFSQYFGPFQFSNTQTGVFRQAQFTLSPAIVAALSNSTYGDLTASVELDFNPNPNPNAGFSDPFYIDKLDFGQSSSSGGGGAGGTAGASGSGGATGSSAAGTGGAGSGSAGTGGAAGGIAGGGASSAATGGTAGGAGTTGAAGTAGSGTTGPCSFTAPLAGGSTDVAFTIKLPKGVHREDIAVATTGGYLTLDDGVSIVKDSGGFASVSSVQAASRTNLGVGVDVQDLYTEATGIDLRANAHVHGALRTAADFTTQTGAVIDGGALQHTSLQPLESISWTVSFPSVNRGNCSLEPDNTEVIDPGSYGDIAVKSRSHLKVRSGTYYFNSLSFEPGSELDIDNSSGPVFIYVHTSFAFSGNVVETNAAHMNFLFGVAGNGTISIQSAFRGVLVAPFASVSLPTNTTVGHVGAFFANSLIAHQNTAIHLRSLSPSEFCASDAACSSFCPCGDAGGVCGGTPVSHEPLATDPNCLDGACCPAGANLVTLTTGADTSSNSVANACVLALAGNDTVSSAAPGVTVVGGNGDDTIAAGQFSPPGTAEAPVRVFGGPGNDTISGWFDGAQIFGGPGDDTISAGPGPVFVAPGSGVDNVSTGDGDDTFILYSECEATPGKKLLANGGFDTLISPLSIDELRARGVTVEGFENVIIQSDACKADCTAKPTCGAGTQCADRGGQAVCGGSSGSSCQTCNDCASGLSCAIGSCQDPCAANPAQAGCGGGSTAPHCTDGLRDGDESDIDCGGSCGACPTGAGCSTDTDCGPDLVCGDGNGACFGHTRAQRVCWSPTCALGTDVGGCGTADSKCGQNCACVNGCDASSTVNSCAPGEKCVKGFGRLFDAPTHDACVDVRCPSDDPNLCGSPSSVCGSQCACTSDCSHATCENPGDGCGGTCPGVCPNKGIGCLDDVNCPAGDSCVQSAAGVSTCLPSSCTFRILAPPLCGVSGAICGDTCPACTPSCDVRQCGADPTCGQSCGTCSAGSFCSADGQCITPTAEAPPLVPDGKGGQKPLADLPPLPTVPVGALKGSFSVSEQGNSQYSVPIEVPPGRAGIEPALTLSYSGSHVNQDQGVGWHLDGLSKITRCPRSYALDGYSAPVQNDKSDLFCLDGKRLEVVAGTYGSAGAEYRTLIDSFAKVVSHIDAGDSVQLPPFSSIPRAIRDVQGPDYFEVRTKDGKILTFGRTQDSLVLARTGIRYAWLLNRVEDRAGNTMVVSYMNWSGNVTSALAAGQPNVVRPSIIYYTGHGSTPGNRSVQFLYEQRSDPQLSFVQGGAAFIAPDRLSHITTYVNNVPVKGYHLVYGPGTLSQIQKIFECAGGDDILCKPPTEFEYTEEHGFIPSLGFAGDDFATAGQLDADGDGVPDFLTTTLRQDGVDANTGLAAAKVTTDVGITVASMYLSPPVGVAVNVIWDVIQGPFWGMFGSDPVITVSNQMAFGSRNRQTPISFVGDITGIPCNQQVDPVFLLDYDQDGKDDVAAACGTHHSQFYVALSGTSRGSLVPFPSSSRPVLSATIGGPRFGALANPVEPKPIVYDVDGDSLQDVVGCEDQYTLDVWRRLKPTPGSDLGHMTQGFDGTPVQLFAPPQATSPKGPHGELPPRPKLPWCGDPAASAKVFDVDGDGVPDLFVHGPDGWVTLRYVAPQGAAKLSFQPVKFIDVGGKNGSFGGQLSLADFNGDGLQDIWDPNDVRQITIWLNAGGGVFTAKLLDRPPTAFNGDFPYNRGAVAVVDYNADGQDDLLQNWFARDKPVNGEVLTHNTNAGLLTDSIVDMFTPVNVLEIQGVFFDTHLPFFAGFSIAADADGDGNRDVFGTNGQVFYGTGVKNTLLKRVVDGLGNVVNVEYDHSDTYNADSCTGVWPEKCLRQATGLVASHTEGFVSSANGEVKERAYTYHYYNARMSVTGHGWLGFDRRTVDMSALNTNVSNTTTIDYQPVARYDVSGNPTASITPPYLYPLAGLPKTTTVDQHVATGPDSTPAPLQSDFFDRRSQTVNTWTVKTSFFHRPFPVLRDRLNATYDRAVLGGRTLNPTLPPFEQNGTPISSCDTGFDVDDYGNVSDIDTTCGQNPNGQGFFARDFVNKIFAPDPSTWLISNPLIEFDFSSRATQNTRSYSFTYTNGLLATVQREPNGDASLQHHTTYVRDDFGNVKQIIDDVPSEPSRTTNITYDVDNIFPATVTNPEGQLTQLGFDNHWGEPAMVIDPNGIASQVGYDGFGREAQSSGPTGTSISKYSNSPTSSVESTLGISEARVQVTVDRQGTNGTRTGSSVVELDNYGRTVRTMAEGFGAAQVIQEQSYDALGRLVGKTLPHTGELQSVPSDRYTYDELQRLVRVDHSDGSFRENRYASTASLKPEDRQWLSGCPAGVPVCTGVTLTIDEEQRQNVVVSDYAGLTVSNIDGDNVVAFQHASNFVYGAFGRLTETHDNRGLVFKWAYDGYGNVLSQTDPDTGTSTYTYNGYDNETTSKDQSQQLRTYQYDSLDRLTSVVDSAGTTLWIYDQGTNAVGRLSQSVAPPTAENPAGQRVSYTYEPPTATGNRGLVQSVEYSIDGTDYFTNFDYDDLGRTSRIHYPGQRSGTPVVAQYQYDSSGALNGLDEVGSGTAKTLWRINDVFQGHLIQDETFGDGAKTNYGYEPNRRFLATIRTTLGQEQVQSLEYTHYKNGQVHTLDAAGSVPLEYQYDNLNRLSAVNTLSDVPTGTPYSYDDIGNIVGRGATVSTYFTGAPHLVQEVGDNSYLYDRNGNVSFRGGPDVPGGSQVLFYTPFNLPRLIATATSDTTQRTTQFDYSADEQRLVRRDVDVSSLHFAGDLYQRKLDTFGTTLEERFRLYAGGRQLGEIVRKDGTDKTLYFHTDHLGSADTISDSDGGARTQHFDPFGTPLDEPNPELTRVGFTGQDQDTDLGLTDMKGRIYDPLAARFTSADPIIQAPRWSQGLNLYSYAFNDPINNTDPSGFDVDGSVPGAVLGWGGGVVGGAALAGFGGEVGLASGLVGLGGGGTGVLSSLLGGPLGGGSAPSTYAVTPTATPKGRAEVPGSMNAVGQNTALTQITPSEDGASELTRSANTSKGGFPIGNVRPGEPITDPSVRRAIRQLWRDSRPATPYAHEEGETFNGFRTRGAGRYSRPGRWRPGGTLDEAGDSGELPHTTAFPLKDTPGVNVFVQVHTHPWPEGTPIDVRGVGVQRIASGPSDGDALGNFLANQRLNTTVIDYTVTPEGIYRTFNGQSQYIAPLQYISR